ncbi:hypothetical protein DFH29DRAFT_512914 [Suillus ampliporus]|nr:hypothetical protein DFH29DRAFT_512914 [Suillus ampliporus]
MEVAVKVFKIDSERVMETIEKGIRREIKVWLQLKHPTIVSLLGTANVDSQFPALVSQWMPSGTLDVYLKEATTLTASAKVGLARLFLTLKHFRATQKLHLTFASLRTCLLFYRGTPQQTGAPSRRRPFKLVCLKRQPHVQYYSYAVAPEWMVQFAEKH